MVGIWTVLRCIFVPNLEIVTLIGGELWHGQAQNGVNFDFGFQFDLEGWGQSPPKTIGILTKVVHTYGPNLVILAWRGEELLRGQAHDWYTHRWTHRQTDAGNYNSRRPKLASGKNWWCHNEIWLIWLYMHYLLKLHQDISDPSPTFHDHCPMFLTIIQWNMLHWLAHKYSLGESSPSTSHSIILCLQEYWYGVQTDNFIMAWLYMVNVTRILSNHVFS